ncbi:MAG: tol-pal system protein YbgF [Alphaproteobacteria bacterium TMED62]|nr:MAG: tol-pal system protein YbgF [Alphaproteobacteria bacterium TMED62]|tara:strand:+ start:2457 stop:3428 length:972 start_codon:yes stop_codon:yes gene_type:complete
MVYSDYNKLQNILLIFLLLFITKHCKSQEKDYLEVVIERINDLEIELKNIQSDKPNNLGNKDRYTNAIAIHEQRLIELEEEMRNLNGSIEQLNFKIDGISKLLNKIEPNLLKQENEQEKKFTDDNQVITSETIEKKMLIDEDPNIEKNPSMKVLGTVNENPIKENQEAMPENNFSETTGGAPQQGIISDEKLLQLLENPSEIYSYAYDMLVRENFIEAEKSFKAFIGEHPNDSLTSNAYYWLGETYYVQKKFQLAAISFARGFQNFPKGNKAIDQLFKLALTFMNLGKNEDACAAFSKLESEFPNAPKRISNRAKDYIKRAKC